MKRVLILGGTGEASRLGMRAGSIADLDVELSVAGCTSNVAEKPGVTRVGGFGGVDGLVQYLRDRSIDMVVDGTHPFANKISHHVYVAAKELDIPRIMLIRTAWEKLLGDDWIEVADIAEAADALVGISRRVFLSIGRKQISGFSHLEDIWFLSRMIEPPGDDCPVPRGLIIFEKGSFNLEKELELLRKYEIDTVVSKNSGGEATYPKIAAARSLGIKVVMINRPSIPPGRKVGSLEAALEWIKAEI